MKRLRVLVLVREGLVPPESMAGYTEDQIDEWKSEYDAVVTLREMGHQVRAIGVYGDLSPLREELLTWKPDIVFVMLEEFHGATAYEPAVVSYLELMKQPYTGCNPLGLALARDKALAKQILTAHGIPTPRFRIVEPGRRLPALDLPFPLLVKSAVEDASNGISQSSVVRNRAALQRRVEFIHENVGGTALIEEFVDGRELYVAIVGNHRLQTFPIWEMDFARMPPETPRIATARIKWNTKYRQRYGITTRPAQDLSPALARRIVETAKQTFRALRLSGPARIDLRLNSAGEIRVLEANPNPNLSYGEDFAEAAEAGGVGFERLLACLLRLGLSYRPPWKQSEA